MKQLILNISQVLGMLTNKFSKMSIITKTSSEIVAIDTTEKKRLKSLYKVTFKFLGLTIFKRNTYLSSYFVDLKSYGYDKKQITGFK